MVPTIIAASCCPEMYSLFEELEVPFPIEKSNIKASASILIKVHTNSHYMFIMSELFDQILSMRMQMDRYVPLTFTSRRITTNFKMYSRFIFMSILVITSNFIFIYNY